jgi:putative nucleotidyltransferase with HDIG domain
MTDVPGQAPERTAVTPPTGSEAAEVKAILRRLDDILGLPSQQEMLLKLRSLAADIDLMVPYHDGHMIRVTCYALAIGDRLGLSPKDMLALEIASLLHDFGKLEVDSIMLEKDRSLNDDETAEVRGHAERGFRILSRYPRLEWAASIIRDHHERFDGGGYPARKLAHSVSLLSRIIAVADAYDAMTTSRPYRKRMSHTLAVRELLDNAGKQFDPLVVRSFLSSKDRESLGITPRTQQREQ